MGLMKHVPGLVKVNGKWRIEGFRPTQQAYCYDEHVDKAGYIYAIGLQGFHKIGFTQNFERRYAQIDTATPFNVERVMVQKVPLAGMTYAEAWVHAQLADKLVKNEWFAVDRDTAIALVKQAKVAGRLFAKECETWYRLDRAARLEPKRAAKLEREYADFLARNAAA